MDLLRFFRRSPPIRDPEALAEFIDQNAAFLTQKGLYEYSRARAGHYAKVLFAEASFQAAIEISRWRAYPLGLAMVGEVTEGILRPHFGGKRSAGLTALKGVVLDVFDRYPVPESLGKGEWLEARRELSHRLDLIGLHPPKPAKDIPELFADGYFALMPIHEKLRGSDFPAIRSYLRVTLCNIHEELTKRLDTSAVAAALCRGS